MWNQTAPFACLMLKMRPFLLRAGWQLLLRLCNWERCPPLPEPETMKWLTALSACLPSSVCVSMSACSPLCLHARHLTSAKLGPPVGSTLGRNHCSPLVCRHRSGKERREGVHRRAAGAEEEKRPTGGGWRQVSRLDNFCYFPPQKYRSFTILFDPKIKPHAHFFVKYCKEMTSGVWTWRVELS